MFDKENDPFHQSFSHRVLYLKLTGVLELGEALIEIVLFLLQRESAPHGCYDHGDLARSFALTFPLASLLCLYREGHYSLRSAGADINFYSQIIISPGRNFCVFLSGS